MRKMLRIPLSLLVLCVPLLFSGAGPAEGARVLLDRIVAVVNSEVITWSELRESIPEPQLQAVKALPEEKARALTARLEAEALERLIETRLQRQAAERAGIEVSDEEVEAAIREVRSKYGLEDDLAFRRSLAAQHLDLETYRKTLRGQILVSRYVGSTIGSTIVVSDEEVEAVLREEYPDLAGDTREARLRLIRLEAGDAGRREEALKTARELLERIRAGEDFAGLARRYSSDPSAADGGDIGFVRRGSILPALDEAAFSLGPGQVSDPVEAGGAVYLVKAEAFRDHSDEAEAARETIRNRLHEEAFQRAFGEWIRKLKSEARIEIRLGGRQEPGTRNQKPEE